MRQFEGSLPKQSGAQGEVAFLGAAGTGHGTLIMFVSSEIGWDACPGFVGKNDTYENLVQRWEAYRRAIQSSPVMAWPT